MARINYTDIIEYIKDKNKIDSGKEVTVYRYNDEVIKIFHEDRKSPIKRISDEGLEKLSTLSLNCFITPNNLIILDDKIVGYTENYIEEKEINFDNIDYNLIKEDIYTLSENGFGIEDLFYNYIFTTNKLYFTDLTSYSYINTDVSFLKERLLLKNITVMNNFLIGLTLFDAFRKGNTNEYTKMYLANEYRLENCSDTFYGDLIKEENNKSK